jgi:predicted ATPase/DNA-binding XRE family transcriptional regulator
MTLAELLVELRTARGLSQEDVAARTGVSTRAIGDLERGATRRPHRETVRALADGLGLEPSERQALERAARSAPPASTRPRKGPRPALAAPVTSIVGRDDDVAALSRLVRSPAVRLATVTGPGGVGKSRLAIEVGWRVGTSFDRVNAVDLSPLTRADDVPLAVASALGCRTAGLRQADAVAAVVGDARWLLVLESFEHVAGAAGTLAALLAGCPRLTALVTSRAPLLLRGEHVWPLAPLPVPPGEPADLAVLDANPAVALLVQRTSAVRPGFRLHDSNAAALARLCRRLDGLPLAIELAAAHLRTQEPAQLLDQLEHGLAGLDAVSVDVPDRHQTLRRTVEWSTGRLAAPERLLLGVLGVFAGGAAPADIAAVLGRLGLPEAEAGVARLDVSISLLAANSMMTVTDRGGVARVGMLDTIREIAVDIVGETGLGSLVRGAHAAYFLGLVQGGAAPDRVDRDLDNVRTALDWAVGHEPALLDAALVRGLIGYFGARGSFDEAGRTLGAVVDAAPDDDTRAWALHGAGIAANERGDHETALGLATHSDALFEKLADPAGRSTALTVIGNAYKALDRYDQAEKTHHTSLELARAAGDDRRVTIALNNLGTLAHDRGDHEQARRHYLASLEIKEALGDRRGTAVALVNLGGVDNDLGHHTDAADRLATAVELFEAVDAQHPLAFALALLAEAQLGTGALDEAEVTATRALELSRRAEYRPTMGLALGRLGDIALAQGDHATAERYLEEALEYAAGAPEIARTLEHLAAVRAVTAPGQVAGLLARAGTVRRTHRTPVPPADRALLDRLRGSAAG